MRGVLSRRAHDILTANMLYFRTLGFFVSVQNQHVSFYLQYHFTFRLQISSVGTHGHSSLQNHMTLYLQISFVKTHGYSFDAKSRDIVSAKSRDMASENFIR